uniref:Uncharacterized protein n=1 Tax=Strombidium inclinatum TaxID=197538 RepID=A0A7S3IWS3_9SPIT|mmetsp:Transcript_6513/g.10464  ORF Transcript_6513/g.10464 Transcript_6513/m.10464 type:complete len:138 (+) Transcript_6513:176-589(+)|eukprot:CAMPEP_0170479058 /NCGR_PEP_ID=MMETSP0208-20121228/426_1 /TAXON_ID=197538 /ORGANISM="Strombidium inclinatum, Strain S3" /LENGTH=137 /DNA_ID=CAMNT_0010751399 /DNA_START=146 /DNA_END=559 /DNA_ORIENTATION=+
MKDGDVIASDLSMAISDLESKDPQDIIAGIKEIGQIIEELPSDLVDCHDMQGDLDRIEAWAQSFDDPKTFIEIVAKNVFKNFKKITQEIDDATNEIKESNFYDAGDSIADVLVLTLGPVPPAPSSPAQPEDLLATEW